MVLRATDAARIAAAHDRLALQLLPSWKLFAVLSYSEPAVHRFEVLKSLRLNLGSNDLRIASIALENQATVVTRNLRDFGRVPGLNMEDWTL